MVKQAKSTALEDKCRARLERVGMPEDEAVEKAATLAAMVEAALKASVSPDMTVPEAAPYRSESVSQTQRKMRSGAYESYLSGTDKRLITRESVEIDRGACLLLGPRFDGSPRGRPRKAQESHFSELA
jgi:hypothetical protein